MSDVRDGQHRCSIVRAAQTHNKNTTIVTDIQEKDKKCKILIGFKNWY